MRILDYDRIGFIAATAIFGVLTAGGSLFAMPQPSWSDPIIMVSPDSPIVMAVNKDQFQGKWKQFKGDLKKEWGKFTDDDLQVIEGNYDKFEGKIQERYGDRKEKVKRWTDEWFEKNGKQSK